MAPELRALRRAHLERMKARTRTIMRQWFGRRFDAAATPAKIGVNASTHCRPCGCWMCKERKTVPPPRERPFSPEGFEAEP